MSRKTVCQKQTLFRERDQDKNLFVLYSWEWDDWSDFVCDANAFCCSKRCYWLRRAKRYPHVNLIYLEARIDPSTWLTIMLWRNIGRLDFQAAKVIICPMLKLQMVGVEQKMAFKLEGKKGFNSKLCPLNRMVFLRQKKTLETHFWLSPGSFWSLFIKPEKWGQKIDLSMVLIEL